MKLKCLYSFVIVIISLASINADLSFPNIFKSTVDVTSGVAKDVANKLPTPKGLFETSKQLVAGYPFEFVSSSINKICKYFFDREATFSKQKLHIAMLKSSKLLFEMRSEEC